MTDIIHLLPDSVANQIAAGEVIQRPASAVKELLENAVDAGSNNIQLIVKDSGKTLIQIIDNGCGMSETDARMCFERHATSKIKSADDLFNIRTMGFRGEALASVAAIAQVEMKTRRHEDEIGTSLEIEGSQVKLQQPVNCLAGTSISIKNLFYNIPARRNFLKSNTVEARHVIEEFERVALAHPSIALSLHQNGLEVFKLNLPNPPDNRRSAFRQRIVSLFGSNYIERLVPVQEETTLLNITGFIGKPEFAKKTRGEQFFFVNNRFIKDAYLHHAVQNAFEELLPHENYASYWLSIEIDPARIDINIHPTKTEIKFDDERSIYSIVRAAVKRSLGQYSVSPSLDFDQERSFDLPHAMRNAPVVPPSIAVNSNYNPFVTEFKKIAVSGWEKLYDNQIEQTHNTDKLSQESNSVMIDSDQRNELISETDQYLFQLHDHFIISRVKNGLMILDRQAAQERVLYEKFLQQINRRSGSVQHDLFPRSIEFSSVDYSLMQELQEDLRAVGFDLREFGMNTFVMHGSPPDLEPGTEQKVLESLLEQHKDNKTPNHFNHQESLARSMAKAISIKHGHLLSDKEMKNLINQLFACEKPFLGIDGKPTVIILNMGELKKMFSR